MPPECAPRGRSAIGGNQGRENGFAAGVVRLSGLVELAVRILTDSADRPPVGFGGNSGWGWPRKDARGKLSFVAYFLIASTREALDVSHETRWWRITSDEYRADIQTVKRIDHRRTLGRDRHYRHPVGPAVAGYPSRSRGPSANQVPKQHPAGRLGAAQPPRRSPTSSRGMGLDRSWRQPRMGVERPAVGVRRSAHVAERHVGRGRRAGAGPWAGRRAGARPGWNADRPSK